MVTPCKRTAGEEPGAQGSGTGNRWTRTPGGPHLARGLPPYQRGVTFALPSSWDHWKLESEVAVGT